MSWINIWYPCNRSMDGLPGHSQQHNPWISFCTCSGRCRTPVTMGRHFRFWDFHTQGFGSFYPPPERRVNHCLVVQAIYLHPARHNLQRHVFLVGFRIIFTLKRPCIYAEGESASGISPAFAGNYAAFVIPYLSDNHFDVVEETVLVMPRMLIS